MNRPQQKADFPIEQWSDVPDPAIGYGKSSTLENSLHLVRYWLELHADGLLRLLLNRSQLPMTWVIPAGHWQVAVADQTDFPERSYLLWHLDQAKQQVFHHAKHTDQVHTAIVDWIPADAGQSRGWYHPEFLLCSMVNFPPLLIFPVHSEKPISVQEAVRESLICRLVDSSHLANLLWKSRLNLLFEWLV